MDATSRPLRVPPEMGIYAEKHELFQLLQNMLEGLLIHKPDEPIQYMISHLKQDNDHVPRICILGPPASGKTTIATWLCKQLNTPCITQETLLEETLELTKEVTAFQERGQKIPNALWANLIQERLSNVDCIKQGWILEGFPENRDQAWMLQLAGITPRHVVVLYAPDTVLIERNLGKRIDPSTKALTYVQTWCRSAAPLHHGFCFVDPPGSGKSLQAALIAQKYSIVNICCGQLLKEAVADKTKLGELIKPYFDSGWPVPDNIILKLLTDRLNRLDCMTDGWVLHGFPRDLDQAEQMVKAGIIPNRIFFLNLPSESVMERLAQRMIDPVTGERYHAMYKPAPLPEVQARLKQNPKDTEENIRICLETYYRHASDLEEFYDNAFYINADQDPYVVFEYIESCIVKPLPHKS
ncbi:adenylate kinase 8 isoform X4 [Dermochelys coriacea]|uniref:adenylate kinase 8 isoform X4 n=1 Tax=Dermochelys coriacea TaxID=27794 RepID=UPI0018E7FE2E|nr:adenylate kinase 8 isoform X4 [Dermochelys coriacea]